MDLHATPQGMVTPATWAFAPKWLTVREARKLSSWDIFSMAEIILEDGVDLNDAGLIEKRSLWEFQETLAEVLHSDD